MLHWHRDGWFASPDYHEVRLCAERVGRLHNDGEALPAVVPACRLDAGARLEGLREPRSVMRAFATNAAAEGTNGRPPVDTFSRPAMISGAGSVIESRASPPAGDT